MNATAKHRRPKSLSNLQLWHYCCHTLARDTAAPLLPIRGKVKESPLPLSNSHNFLLEDSDPGASSGPQNTAEPLHLACCF